MGPTPWPLPKEVMNRDKSDITTLPLQSLAVFRGIYKRVATQLDIDPSYVSRVARGERNAPYVSDALRKEIQRAMGKAGLHDGNGQNSTHNGNGNNHDHSNRTMAALLNGRPTDGQRNGDRVASNGDQSGRKSRKTQKSASATRRRKR
jgi:hypothetical protein